MQLSNAADENPSMIHTGLASILPGKTVHAHVSDKPTNNRPAISGPSMNAALQVQEQARKQHQQRLESLKLKLKKLRQKLEGLQRDGNTQETISSGNKQHNINKEEISTLNELRMATQDAIKELHTDYPHAKKKQVTGK
jgi:chromosome segregation ATPase